jgi:signal transduction histidine kinase/CheY-like chemotaxis protein
MKAVFRSVRTKLVLVMTITLALVGASTSVCVWWLTDEAIHERQRELEHQIRLNLSNKGAVLSKSHAVALGPLVSDNAFGDVKKLVEETVTGDHDIVYGLFLSADRNPWAYVSPTHPITRPEAQKPVKLDGWKELGLDGHGERRQERELFGQPILEFAEAVTVEGENLGTIRYGLTMAGLKSTLDRSREQAFRAKNKLLSVLGMLGGLILFGGILLMARAARTLTMPLSELTAAARLIASGERSHRVLVKSGDEMEVLAGAFNHMIDENEKQFAVLERTTEQALEASRLKSEFLANMSHEIRTPMNGVLGTIKLLLRQPLDQKARRYADTAQASAHALMTIVNDILDFSKMEAGKYTLQSAEFDARLVVQEVVELLSSRAQGGVEMIYRVSPDFPSLLFGDPDRFRQVLNNLVGNAVKFTDQGEIFIDMSYEQESDTHIKCQVAVIDSGVGIPPEAMNDLFQAFSQADGTMKRKHGGTGLGLTISRRLAQMMGGEITVESTLGVGSKFTVTFSFEVRPGVRSYRNLDWTRGKRIAIVESSARWTRVIEEHLSNWGIESAAFRNHEDALAALHDASRQGRDYHAIVLGLRLTDETSRVFVNTLRSSPHLKSLPIIALTQLGTSATISEVEHEIAAQVQKPLRLSELFNALQETFLPSLPSRGQPQKLEQSEDRKTDRPVLVVDDNEINQMVAVEELEYAGYRAEVANDGLEALKKVKNGNYLLVLMDCQMPVMDGYTATRKIREFEDELGRHTPIIALTAHAMAGERERVLGAGMDDYLSKPFRPESLRKLMRQHGILASQKAYRSDVRKSDDSSGTKMQQPSVASELTTGARRSEKLVELFLKNVPGQILALRDAVDQQDAPSVRAHAHKLKGSCLAMDAPGMAEAAERLQHMSEKGDLSLADALTKELGERFSRVEAEVASGRQT